MNLNIISKAKLVALAKGVARAAGGAALLAAIAYITDHQADSPALYGAAIIALHDVYEALKRRNVVTASR